MISSDICIVEIMEKRANVISESADFDRAVFLTGYGRFNYEIIVLCFLCILTVGFQNGIPSYVFPAAQCELKLTSFHLGILNVSFLTGGIISCFLWGVLADLYGRKRILSITHLLNSSVTIMCSISPFTASLVVCRFLNGFLIGAPGSIIFTYITEFQPPKYRTRTICYCGLFFTLSWLLLPTLAYFILPLNINYGVSKIFRVNSWRIFMILITVPEILATLWFLRVPESPKFYLAKNNPRQALMILRKMYFINTGRSPELYPIKCLIGEMNTEANISSKFSCDGKVFRIVRNIFQQTRSLFDPPLLKYTILTCAIMFANMFGMFGLGLWLPDLFVRFVEYQHLHPNASVSIKLLSSLPVIKNVTCDPNMDSTVIKNTIIMALASILYNGLCSWLSTRTTNKNISMLSMLFGGISSCAIFFMTSSVQNLVVACIFQATMITANMTIAGIGVELFPTKINGIAVCLIMCFGRVGASVSNLVFGYLIDKYCEVPISLVAAIVLIGSGLCWFVPNSEKCQDKKETREQISIIGAQNFKV